MSSLSEQEILREISLDRALGLQMCFPDRHTQKTPAFHVEVVDAWRAADEFVLIEAFRGAGKTTLAEEFLTLEALFKNFSYALIIGETYEKTLPRMEAIKRQLTGNGILARLFGGKQKGGIWRENVVECANGVLLQVGGWDQEFRGFLFNSNRPDRAYLDDVQNKTMCKDSAAVDANWSRVYTELIPCLDPVLRKLRFTQTPLAADCMVRRAKEDPRFVALSFPICNGDIDDPSTESAWPERYPMDWIRAERDSFARQGLLRQFQQEYMLVSAQTQQKPFREDQLRFSAVAPHAWLPRKAIYDPARTMSVKTSDQYGKVVVSRFGTKLIVHESKGAYWKPSEMIADTFDAYERHKGAEICVEENSLEEWLKEPMRAEQLRRGVALPVRTLRAPQEVNKAEFITGLAAFFEAGDVVFVGSRQDHAMLISQLLNFPAGKRDVLNALAYAQRVFAGKPIYEDFTQDNIGVGLEPTRDAQLILCINQKADTTACVLLAVEGQPMTVLADWISTLSPPEAIADAVSLVRAVFPGRRFRAMLPADAYDQQNRNPVVRALSGLKVPAQRGAYPGGARGGLSSMLRTEMRGRRMLLVDQEARTVLHGLAGAYCYAQGRDGRGTSHPESGVYEVACEALECAVAALSYAGQDELPDGVNLSRNAQGAQYMTSLPQRK